MHEVNEPTPWRLLESAIAINTADEKRSEKLVALIKLSMWGNKADGAYKEVKDTITGSNVSSLAFNDQFLLTNHTSHVLLHCILLYYHTRIYIYKPIRRIYAPWSGGIAFGAIGRRKTRSFHQWQLRCWNLARSCISRSFTHTCTYIYIYIYIYISDSAWAQTCSIKLDAVVQSC
jgi:hypothetical protein